MRNRSRLFPTFTVVFLLVTLLLTSVPGSAYAQTYSFSLEMETVDVYWNTDGTASIDYVFGFSNSPSASAIDFVDVGVPNENYNFSSVSAEVDGQPVAGLEVSPYVTPGIAVNLGSRAIRPGESGQVRVRIGEVRRVLYPDSDDENYVSAVFGTTWFDSSFVNGTTNMLVTFHLPAGVQPDEPRWHAAPSGFPDEPETGFDEEGRVIYRWHNPSASPSRQYTFGASFPAEYVPAEAIVRPDPFEGLANFIGGVLEVLPLFLCGGFFVLIIGIGMWSEQRRKLQYLPPKIAIEGHGIKRGLTAIEAAILMEQPLDKILTMTLFSVIKKGAAQVMKRDPLQLNLIRPFPEGLNQYELDFLQAFSEKDKAAQRKELQSMMISLVKSVESKMKGFSRRETIAYYQDIMNRAWAQVEAADTPEVKSQKFDEVMEWTMLDRKYDDRTRDVFRTGPVFVPVWWPRYDPTFSMPRPSTGGGGKVSVPSGRSGQPSMPTLPGSDFAGSIVTGVQGFAAGVVGNINDFTGGITNRTNPPPKSTSSGKSYRSGGGGGGGCACACACAGCACACAGGGR